LNSSPAQRASKWAVNFGERTEREARSYPESWRIVASQVWPLRNEIAASSYPGLRERWWQYWRPRGELYRALASSERVLVIAQTSKTVMPAFVEMPTWFDKALRVFTYEDDAHFGLLTSSLHWSWAATYGSTMRTDLRYTPSDVFETFAQPMPQSGSTWERVADAGRALNEFRAGLMVRTKLGLTKTYNRIHNPKDSDHDIVRLRELHVKLDCAVRDAYGWTDLELDHHHWETQQGVRFTVSPAAKDELLDRLLELNHQRYAEEVAAGLHDKRPKRAQTKRTRAVDVNQESIL
jgi:hypothetical protein